MYKTIKALALSLILGLTSLTSYVAAGNSYEYIDIKPIVIEEPASVPIDISIRSYEPEVQMISSFEVEPLVVEEVQLPASDEEIDLLALVTMAEAEDQGEYGQRLVIDTILNRVDHPRFPDTIDGVIYQKNQFSSMWEGRAGRCYVMDDIRELVIEELTARTNSNTIFFRTGRYSDYGTPMFKEVDHYFSCY